MKHFYTFGQAYGEGAYGECTYSPTGEQCETNTGGSTGGGAGTGAGSGSGSLVDTGVAIALAVTLACLLIFITLVVRLIRRPRAATQEAVAENPRRDSDNYRS